jgi:hypothetical protein
VLNNAVVDISKLCVKELRMIEFFSIKGGAFLTAMTDFPVHPRNEKCVSKH